MVRHRKRMVEVARNGRAIKVRRRSKLTNFIERKETSKMAMMDRQTALMGRLIGG